MESALYRGHLRHRRFEPRAHSFDYPVFMAFLDIDRLPELMSVSPFSSYNSWNWTSYDERDHFGDPQQPLRLRLQKDAAVRGISLPDGQIFLLTHLRYFGYVFNPVSFFYCYDRQGHLSMLLSEVNSTFGESHNYWLTPANEKANAAGKRYRTAKSMHVSPFHSMELDYDWIFTPPSHELVAHMNTRSAGKINFDATLQLERRPWQPKELLSALSSYPFMTLRIMAAIHWEALRLWCKGVPVYTHPSQLDKVPAGSPSKGTLAR